MQAEDGFEWPTLVMLGATYAVWGTGTVWLWPHSGILAVVLTTLAITQFSSLQHEVLHGHPFRRRLLNEALVFPGLTLFVPYVRFRDTHLAHHHDPILTDPYDDPESNYLDPAVWGRLPRMTQWLLRVNNTLAGRMALGPVIGTWYFVKSDLALIRGGDRDILRAWALHGAGVALVLAWLWSVGTMPVWAWVLSAYLAYAVLKIRTFLEHRAHEMHRARTVIIEDRGPLALLYLNNNLHVVHHMHPQVPWYRLPAVYTARRDHFQRRNEGYVYRSYAEIFRKHFLRAKDPVPHPVWPVRKD
ncbi:MAG: fatty acid desaturase [Paracoccaceae bacterium]